jgi:hypothetical protein
MTMSQQDLSNSGAIEDKTLSKEDLIEFLDEEDDKPETLELDKPKKEEKAKETKDGKDEDDKTKEDKTEKEEKVLSLEEELEKELEEPDEETELDLVAPPSRREILTKYPTLFKDFPHVEKAIYREQKYSELLPTIKDAQQAVERSQQLEQYENELKSGSTESLLSSIRDKDKEAYAKVVDNYLPTLFKVDQSAYYHTVGNVIKHTIISMIKEAKSGEDDDLSAAAAVLNKFMFGSDQFTYPTKLSKEEAIDDTSKKKLDEVSQKEQEFNKRQFEIARDSLGTKVDNIIKATIDRVIDPNDSMPEVVKKYASREVLEGLEEAINKDVRFKNIFDKLWKRAFDSNFNAESMDKIQKAYLSKAKTLLPHLISKARVEALKGLKKTNGNDDKDKRGHLPVGKVRSSTTRDSGNAKGDSKQFIPKGMSTLDFLNQDD